MKTVLRSGLLCLLLLCALALTACSGGVSRGEAKDATEALFLALSAGDYEEAASLFHPAAGITPDLMKAFCETLQEEFAADVTEGIVIDAYTGMRSAYYDSNVGGSLYELTMNVKIGGTPLSLTTEVIRTETGFGIRNIHCNP